eukprot:1662449-Rhodomonas_salina.1
MVLPAWPEAAADILSARTRSTGYIKVAVDSAPHVMGGSAAKTLCCWAILFHDLFTRTTDISDCSPAGSSTTQLAAHVRGKPKTKPKPTQLAAHVRGKAKNVA